MGKPRTLQDKAKQKERTLRNKRKKYERALKDFPDHKDRKIWEAKLAGLKQSLDVGLAITSN